MQRHLRLRHQADFERLRINGHTRVHPALRLSFMPNRLSHNRYGIIVSKRMGNAVMRNQIRRRLRACLRHVDQDMVTGYDMVFIARVPIKTYDYHDIEQAVQKVLRQAKLLAKKDHLTS